jgi:integrase
LSLPRSGWGYIEVRRSWNGTGANWGDESENEGMPKTESAQRTVPISPILVKHLRDWIAENRPTDSLFISDEGKRPSQSNWNRSLKAACEKVGIAPLSPYGLRRTCATHMVYASVLIAEAAARLGHSPEVLLTYYTKRMSGGEERSNQLLDAAYESTS